MGNFTTFEELACWKEARKMRNFVKDELVPKFPKTETYSLKDQINRSARSFGNNIAEGFGRFHFQENIPLCRIARGSLYETLDHAIIAFDEGFISENDLSRFREIFSKTLLILNGYIKYLRSKKSQTK